MVERSWAMTITLQFFKKNVSHTNLLTSFLRNLKTTYFIQYLRLNFSPKFTKNIVNRYIPLRKELYVVVWAFSSLSTIPPITYIQMYSHFSYDSLIKYKKIILAWSYVFPIVLLPQKKLHWSCRDLLANRCEATFLHFRHVSLRICTPCGFR